MNIRLYKGNYSSNFNCPIAKGLKRKLIISKVRSCDYKGLFLGFIPVWGKISRELNEKAMDVADGIEEPAKEYFKIGLYN